MRVSRRRLPTRLIAERLRLAQPELHLPLARDGYVRLTLLDADALDQFRTLHATLGVAPGDDGSGLFNDTWSTDVAWKAETGAQLRTLVEPRLVEFLPNYRGLGFAHIIKWPGAAGAVVAHRDPTFVDEHAFRSLMLWFPLDDVDIDGGALWVVPGSHRQRTGIRVHQSPDNLVHGIRCDTSGPARPVCLRAGEAILYDHALVHLSGPNRRKSPRVAVAGPLVPRMAPIRYAVPVGDSESRVLEVDESFFIQHRLCALDTEAVLRQYRTVETAGPGRESER